MSDCIDRQILIDLLTSRAETLKDLYGDLGGAASGVKKLVQTLPSAEQKGRWQRRKGSDCWECSQCHAVMESDDIVRHNFYYCYHCGADMMNEDGYMRLEGTDHE